MVRTEARRTIRGKKQWLGLRMAPSEIKIIIGFYTKLGNFILRLQDFV